MFFELPFEAGKRFPQSVQKTKDPMVAMLLTADRGWFAEHCFSAEGCIGFGMQNGRQVPWKCSLNLNFFNQTGCRAQGLIASEIWGRGRQGYYPSPGKARPTQTRTHFASGRQLKVRDL